MSQDGSAYPGRVVVVIPTYNERENLATVVAQVLALDGVSIIVVDDRSPDGTGDLADALAREHAGRVSVLHRDGPRGMGRAYLAGFEKAIADGADVICQMDSDGSHDVRDLPLLLEALRTADLVIGSRYIPKAHVSDWPLTRRVLSRVGNTYVRLVTGLSVHDVTGGFRAWRRDALQRLHFDQIEARGHGFQVEMTKAATAAGLRIAEAPISFRDRRHGVSKVSGRIVLESLVSPWRVLGGCRGVANAARAGRVAAGVLAVLAVIEAVSLVRRGARGASDIGVFYRTCALLREGVRNIYPRADVVTGWPISMPPLGFAIFQPFSTLGAWGSSAAWAVFNLGLLALSLVMLRRVLWRTGEARYECAYPWAAALLLALAAGSIQVGQFSVLFVACWLLFIDAFGRGRRRTSALWLGIPAAIKIYPVGIVAAPVSAYLGAAGGSTTTRLRRGISCAATVAAAIVALWLLVPAIPYGTDTITLNASWWRGVILNNAQMDYLQSLRAITNQSLDTMLLRFLSYDPAFHDRFTAIPHLAFPKATVLKLAHVVRLIIVAITASAVWKAVRRSRDGLSEGAAITGTEIVGFTALWVATLYNVVPETKARYAVYTFIAFLPWLARAIDPALPRGRRAAIAAFIVFAAICALVLLPDEAQAWGIGFVGPFVLWIGNVRFVAAGSRAEGVYLASR